jgi:hypothetical protein
VFQKVKRKIIYFLFTVHLTVSISVYTAFNDGVINEQATEKDADSESSGVLL